MCVCACVWCVAMRARIICVLCVMCRVGSRRGIGLHHQQPALLALSYYADNAKGSPPRDSYVQIV